MILIWESLNDTLHQVLLSKCIFANHNDLKNLGQHTFLIDFISKPFEAAQSDDVLTHSYSQFVSFNFFQVFVFLGAQVLKSYPQSVHFTHVLEDEINGVVYVTVFWSFVF